jgi:nicotinamidase-related amidase
VQPNETITVSRTTSVQWIEALQIIKLRLTRISASHDAMSVRASRAAFQRSGYGKQRLWRSLMANPKLEVLTPQNSQIIFIDHQPQMAFGVQSIDRQPLKNNVVALAKAAKVFKIPTTITTVETQGFSGYTYPELLDVFPDKSVLERTSMNSWDDKKVRDALKANGRNKVVVSGLWVEVCNNTFALSAMLEGGYEIYMVADASGGTSKEAHDYSMQRISRSASCR